MSATALIEKMQRRDSLSALERAVLHGILSPPRSRKARSNLVRAGDRPTESTLLLTGYCGRYVSLPNGKRQITQLNIAGDFIDLHSFLMKQMDHGVVALSDCTFCTVPHTTLQELTVKEPHLTRLLWLETVVDAAIHRQLIASIGLQTATARLAHLLCELCVRVEAISPTTDHCFRCPLSQSQIGEVLGLSAVQVNRSAMALRAQKLVSWKQGEIRILAWDDLAALGDFSPEYLRLQRDPV